MPPSPDSLTTLLAERGGRLKVLALTGIRSEYDLLYPLLAALHAHPAFDVGVIVCGAHLTGLHHESVRQIEADGLRIAERIENLLHSSSRVGKVRSTGLLIAELGQTLAREAPDLLITLGDREEPVAGGLSGLYLGIPVVHLAGGDHIASRDGNPDESIRHAATKLSHIHLTMNEAHAARVRALGEEPWRVHAVGSGGVDRLRTEPCPDRATLCQRVGDGAAEEYLILIHHPLPDAGLRRDAEEAELCIEAALANGLHLFIGAPNSDPGHLEIQRVIDGYADHPQVTVYRHLERNFFLSLLRHALCLVGNSSLAFHEAPFLGLPAVNVGERQRDRMNAGNVQNVPAEPGALTEAIRRAAFDAAYRQTVRPGHTLYGDGHMAQRSLEILLNLPGKRTLLAKGMTV
ncbi:MAG: UDP-N-acetylglucosamine 2-epimerase (hydrolyzing) [Magnetococcales bacterium]|nr:UDP-N-acetylglucosamine 2-epimerase (hydrolyzing) [Magnetococcales bacterium]